MVKKDDLKEEREFLELMKIHHGLLIKVSKIYMDNRDDQEDLKQEILFQLWKAYPNFKGNSQFSTWMYRVAINTAITFFKQEKKRHIFDQFLETKHDQQEVEDHLKDEQLTHFYRAIHCLNKIEKAIILYSIEGYPQKQIAKELGLSEVNTRVKVKRTKEKLKSLIKTQGYEF